MSQLAFDILKKKSFVGLKLLSLAFVIVLLSPANDNFKMPPTNHPFKNYDKTGSNISCFLL
jgi:hypothetical protein